MLVGPQYMLSSGVASVATFLVSEMATFCSTKDGKRFVKGGTFSPPLFTMAFNFNLLCFSGGVVSACAAK